MFNHNLKQASKMHVLQQIKTSMKLKTGSDFTISILYEGFDNPWAHVEEGNKESQSMFSFF